MLALAPSAGCLITDPVPFVNEAPLTPPRIVDQAGVTRPRVGNIVVTSQTPPAQVDFRVPVEDDGLSDPLQYQFFIDQARECVGLDTDGGASCEPSGPTGTIEPDGSLRRLITRRIPMESPGCHRIELWVTSSRFPSRGNFHTPQRAGDVAFASWWIFVPATAGASVDVSVCTPVQP